MNNPPTTVLHDEFACVFHVRAPFPVGDVTNRAAFGITVQGHSYATAGDRQNAMTVCSIGTQPVIPVVYGVKAPL